VGRLRETLSSPSFWVKFHLTLAVFWTLLTIPAVTLWRDSVPFLVSISMCALVLSSISAVQAARADSNSPSREDILRIQQGQRVHIAAVLALQREVKDLRARIG
jgi:hypothetical protein